MEKRAREVTRIKDRQIGEGIARSDHSRSKEGMTRPSGQDRQSAVEGVGKQLQRRWRDILSSAEMETADRQLADADTCRPMILVPPLDGATGWRATEKYCRQKLVVDDPRYGAATGR
jgi:hypothetical protein